ncbi:MAG: hypothetical protein IT353_19625 [Gemmatimonadaceae bacterium]|nr:hypothetical protein [Gemmatimonadaceae bacterium]
MKTLTWLIRALLALLFVAGGGYKIAARAALAQQFPTLPPIVWGLLGAVELVGGILLLIPAITQRRPNAATRVTGLLLVETLFISIIYAQQSTAMSAENPLVWSVMMIALLVVLLAGQRMHLRAAGVHA